jgi:hypothetical protein
MQEIYIFERMMFMKAKEVFGKAMCAASLFVAAIPLGAILISAATVEDAMTDEESEDILDGYRRVLEKKRDKIFNS